ncbi:MAG: hypothetical protein DRP02_14175 [Candidatus Gerdarchaeota archaeon]|nr:MAG: hypothetical protein DRP02_14175 [Candidatus Gerdarchaeota archaeon]
MRKSNSKGFALIMIVMFSIILLITLVISKNFILSHYKIVRDREEWQRKYYLCEAGLKKGRWIIEHPKEIEKPNEKFDLHKDYTKKPYTYNWTLIDGRNIEREIRIKIEGDYDHAIDYKISATVQ